MKAILKLEVHIETDVKKITPNDPVVLQAMQKLLHSKPHNIHKVRFVAVEEVK